MSRRKAFSNRLVYVELKTGHSDDGPAWVARAQTSKSGETLYSNGKAFKRLKGAGISGNFFDVETGEEYWISGIKKDQQDRRNARAGIIEIDIEVVAEYLRETGREDLPPQFIRAQLLPAEPPEGAHNTENAVFSAPPAEGRNNK